MQEIANKNISNNSNSLDPNFVIVGMSGGVDSSVAALLLKQQGLRVEGMFMKNWEEDDSTNHCTAAADLEDAKRACDVLGIPLHTVNFATEYWDTVFEHFLAEYRAFRTPNPDIMCNSEIKFKVFLEYATLLGASHIATGHYARISSIPDSNNHNIAMHSGTNSAGYLLHKALDKNKDQSYFLHALNQAQLRHAIFPLASLTKPEVRKIAMDAKLPNHQKKDSTGICFIGERKFKEFLQHYLPAQPGNIVTLDGKIVGTHDGLMFYTIGQRQGLSIGGMRDSNNEPWYVAGKQIANNELVVVQGIEHPALYTSTVVAKQLTWINDRLITPGTILVDNWYNFPCKAKLRYRQADQDCSVSLSPKQDQCHVEFHNLQRAVTPGQSIVFYQDDICLGGGIIV